MPSSPEAGRISVFHRMSCSVPLSDPFVTRRPLDKGFCEEEKELCAMMGWSSFTLMLKQGPTPISPLQASGTQVGCWVHEN